MEWLIQGAVGIGVGAILAFLGVGFLLRKNNNRKTDEVNKKADLVIQEARLTAKRMVDDAETNAEKIQSKAEFLFYNYHVFSVNYKEL